MFFHEYNWNDYSVVDFEELMGKTIKEIVVYRDRHDADDQIHILTDQNELYIFAHQQECCEHVTIEDICGNINNLVGYQILKAIQYHHSNTEEEGESSTYTFYKLASSRGWVDIRWHGTSNGYYSEKALLFKIEK